MVNSYLIPTIKYVENKDIEEQDIGFDACQFEIELFSELEAMIAVGKANYKYQN